MHTGANGGHFKSTDIKSFVNSLDRNQNRKCKSRRGRRHNISRMFREDIDVTYTVETGPYSQTWPYHTDTTCTSTRTCCRVSKKYGHHYTRRWLPKVPKISKSGKFSYDLYYYDHDDATSDQNEDDLDEEHLCEETGFRANESMELEMYVQSKPQQRREKQKIIKYRTEYGLDTKLSRHYVVIDRPTNEFPKLNDVHENIISKKETCHIRPLTTDSGNEQMHRHRRLFRYKVKTEQLHEVSLSDRFGRLYVQGDSIPRCFVIFNEYLSTKEPFMYAAIMSEENGFSVVTIMLLNVENLHLEGLFNSAILDFKALLDACFPRNDVLRISKVRSDNNNIDYIKLLKPKSNDQILDAEEGQ